MDYKDILPGRIKEARENFKGAKMTQGKLAEAIGVENQMISYYENGNKTPPLDRLYSIANTLGVSVSWLLGEETHDNEFHSYADIMKSMVEMTVAFQSDWKICVEEEAIEDPYDRPTQYFRTSKISIEIPAFFEKKVNDWLTMNKLRIEGTIDWEIYNTWFSKVLQELGGIPLDCPWEEQKWPFLSE